MSRTVLCCIITLLLTTAPTYSQSKSYRLPAVDIKDRVIWGTQCELPDGTGLSFGGQDQDSETGRPHTRIKLNDQWVSIHQEVWLDHAFMPTHRLLAELAGDVRGDMVTLRGAYLSGKLTMETEAAPTRERWRRTLAALSRTIKAHHETAKQKPDISPADRDRLALVIAVLHDLAEGKFPPHTPAIANGLGTWPQLIAELQRTQTALEQLSELLAGEPGARALSPLVYDEKTKLFVLFAGDHLDYLKNDTWVFDSKPRKWTLRLPKAAPPPRANHKLEALGDGRVQVTGGYTYTSNTDYMGGQYRDMDDGTWVYDITANTWTHSDPQPRPGVSPLSRTYRTGAFHPDFFLQGSAPDVTAHEKILNNLPVNQWVSMKPPLLPQMNRDWGTAVMDPTRDLMLRFSGGHSAHGGSDVLHYHFATNRWELPFPVEFPLGQTYTNTEYPRGYNFNRRPWVTGHTYQSYGFDPMTRSMLFTGETNHTYVWEPEVAEWTGRFAKPKGMAYGSAYYTLTLCTTKHGLICWTQQGELYQFDHDHRQWMKIPTTGDKLPGSVVDNSTVVYDSKRDRLLFFRKPYGDKTKFDGVIHSFAFENSEVSTLKIINAAAASVLPYLCQIRYDEVNDVLLVGGTLEPDGTGFRRTPILNLANNEWQSCHITGDDPNGKKGRNVSLGLMYDANRKQFWAVDTNSHVYVLRLDPAKAQPRAME